MIGIGMIGTALTATADNPIEGAAPDGKPGPKPGPKIDPQPGQSPGSSSGSNIDAKPEPSGPLRAATLSLSRSGDPAAGPPPVLTPVDDGPQGWLQQCWREGVRATWGARIRDRAA